MHESLLAGGNFNHGSKVKEPRYRSLHSFADLKFFRDEPDAFLGRMRGFFSGTRDKYIAGLLYIDLGAGFCDYFINCFAAGADNVADFINRNFHSEHARREWGK